MRRPITHTYVYIGLGNHCPKRADHTGHARPCELPRSGWVATWNIGEWWCWEISPKWAGLHESGPTGSGHRELYTVGHTYIRTVRFIATVGRTNQDIKPEKGATRSDKASNPK